MRRNNFFKIWFNCKTLQMQNWHYLLIKTELPAFLLASTTKQTAQCQSVADRQQEVFDEFIMYVFTDSTLKNSVIPMA